MTEDEIYRLEQLIIQTIKKFAPDDVQFEFSVTLPCGCCSESRHFYAESEEVEGKSDEELIDLFDDRTEIFLSHVTSWYEIGDCFSLELS